MIRLTEEQQKQLLDDGWPPRALIPSTGERFVLVHEEMFERVRAILHEKDEITAVEEMLPLTSEMLDSDETSSRESA